MFEDMQRMIMRVSIEQEKKESERARFSLDKLIRGKKAVELPEDYLLPKEIAEQKESLSKIFEELNKEDAA